MHKPIATNTISRRQPPLQHEPIVPTKQCSINHRAPTLAIDTEPNTPTRSRHGIQMNHATPSNQLEWDCVPSHRSPTMSHVHTTPTAARRECRFGRRCRASHIIWRKNQQQQAPPIAVSAQLRQQQHATSNQTKQCVRHATAFSRNAAKAPNPHECDWV